MDKANIRYTGRFDFQDERGPRFAWSGCMIYARFHGTGITSRLKSSGENFLLVIIDGKIVQNVLCVTGEKDYCFASGMEEGIHEISIVRRNEFYFGSIQFLGFDIQEGDLLPLPSRKERRIEIVGDSITCGFGNEGSLGMAYHHQYDNAYLSYAAIAGRLLEAECHLISYSGFGIIRDYQGNEENILPNYYDFILPEEDTTWDFRQWIPQLVGIHLGTNDFGYGTVQDRDKFTGTYIDFIHKIRSKYPNAHILCMAGTTMHGKHLEMLRDYIQNGIVAPLKKSGFERISYLELDQQKEADGIGIDGHPSIQTHRLAGQKLYQAIKKILCGSSSV